jgi:uncharacterized membrane protein (UPF0127 family)
MIASGRKALAPAGEEMERLRFCVYDQTSECFLSLGVTAADTLPARLKLLLGRRTLRSDGGLWIVPSTGFHTFTTGMAGPIDLVYLDEGHRVVHVVESFPRFRIAPLKRNASSLLALPAHTVYSSQTQLGNQLVICVAEEMEFRLRSASSLDRPVEMSGFDPGTGSAIPRERRRMWRQMWPRLVAYDWNGANLVVHGIRDASATGLYLLTEKRWPLGSLVTMTLQRADVWVENSELSITVQLKVVRWGVDGVGLAFVLPETLESTPWIDAAPAGEELNRISTQDQANRVLR